MAKEVADPELATLLNQTAKERENRQLYKLVNLLKQRVTDLELETTGQSVTIEDLRAQLEPAGKGE